MKQQSVNIAFTRDELFWLKSACAFLTDPKRCTQPLHEIASKINGAFMRLDRKERAEKAVGEVPFPLIEFIDSAPPGE
jgi:hypothetical protein